MIRKCLVGAEIESANETAIVESVWEMFRFNMVSQIPGHVTIVLITNSTSLLLPILRYKLVKVFQALELSLNKNIIRTFSRLNLVKDKPN